MKPKKLISIISISLTAGYFLGYCVRSMTNVPGISFQHQQTQRVQQSESAKTKTQTNIESNSKHLDLSSEPRSSSFHNELYNKLFEEASFEEIFPNNALSEDLCECLAMTPAERNEVNNSLLKATAAIKVLQRANVKITRSEADISELVIKKFPMEGSATKQLLLGEVVKTIGPERTAVFSRITMRAIKQAYLGFGESDVAISVKGLNSNGSCKVTVKSESITRMFDSQKVPDVLRGIMEYN